ncbi:MAG: TIR domain-containing protein [Cyanothece sp. SIO1E1]|nr:TIR domain-containing protein [Cyanothece sp. SIO1E1]
MNTFQDAFISYGRIDSKSFGIKLYERLTANGLKVWFDFEDIPLGVDYQTHINRGIESVDNFLYVISPHAVNSPYCLKEIELAIQLNKRIIPLMHVEEISWETWKQRHPHRSEDAWHAYKDKGLHASFANMHPEIAKINWVWFREGIDDFEQSLAGLLNIFERHQQYVRQHTHFLINALEWDRNQRQSRYLLAGEERQQGEDWLKISCQEENAPCLPTDLHCEFICESIKQANNLMTQVFLSYSDHDRAVMDKIRKSLMRKGFTVWTNRTDIKTGTDFKAAINRGIEEANNLVYLITADSLNSDYCKAEIEHAQKLNKRIIPLLIKSDALEQIPPNLKSLQFINFANNKTEVDYRKDIDKLVKILHQDAAYYERHKTLLVKALKWEQHQRNACMLLQGYSLRDAAAWLKVAKQHTQHSPLRIQQEFIATSLQQPPDVSPDVFVCYSRSDSGFAHRLNDALQVQGKITWFDQENIASGADFQQEIYRGIETSKQFLFIISPNSINSTYCTDEIEYALKQNKKITSVLCQPVNPQDLHPALANIQWIDFHQKREDFDAHLGTLIRTLDADPEHLNAHTRFLVRALEWDKSGRDESLLLRGNALKEAQQWILHCEGKSPQPTPLHQDYITASHVVEIQRQRTALRIQRIGLGVISVISLIAIMLGFVANKNHQQAIKSEREAQVGQLQAQTKTAEALFQSNQAFDALLEAIRAGGQLQKDNDLAQDTGIKAKVVTALQQAVFWVQEQNRLEGHEGIVWGVSVSPQGDKIASASVDGTVKLWRTDGSLIATLPANGKDMQVLGVDFSPDGKLIAVAGEDKNVELWQAEGSASTPSHILKGHTRPITSVSFSPDGNLIASASEDYSVRLWRPDGKLVGILEAHFAPVRSVTFSPNGQFLASASDDRTIRLWNREGKLIRTIRGHNAQVRSVRFSPDGQKLASASWDNTVRLWQLDGTAIYTIPDHDTLVYDVGFSPDGKMLASASRDKTVKLWAIEDGSLLTTLSGHSAQVRSLQFFTYQQENLLVSAGGDRTVRIWRLNRPLLRSLQAHNASVHSVAFAPDGRTLASSGADDNIRIWDRTGNLLRTLTGHTTVVWQTVFSPNGKLLASASSDYTIKLWDQAGKLLKTLTDHRGPVRAIAFSPDGQWLASGSADMTVRLWSSAGDPIQTLKDAHTKGILTVAFSPDSKTLASAGWDRVVKLWPLVGGKIQAEAVRELQAPEGENHTGWIYDVTFGPDGKIATASYDNTVKLWTPEGDWITTLTGHTAGVVAVSFSENGQLLATASYDNTVNLWDTQTGMLVTTLRGHQNRVNDVSFSLDRGLIATAGEDQRVLLWELNLQGKLDDLLAQGCQWTQNYLQNEHSPATDQVRGVCSQYLEVSETVAQPD